MGYRIEVILEMPPPPKKKKVGGSGGCDSSRTGDGSGGGCVPRIKVIVKMQKKVWGRVGGCDKNSRVGGCDPRIEVILKNAKKSGSGREGLGLDVNKELVLL